MAADSIIIGLTMGDPAGIGPEIAVKALTGGNLARDITVLVIGDVEAMKWAMRILGVEKPVHILQEPGDLDEESINVYDMHIISLSSFTRGSPSAECGRAGYAYVEKAIRLALDGDIDAIVTNPINKEALRMAGVPYPGHTEMLADKTGTTDYAMVFMMDNVAVSHVTTHCSLRQAIELVTRERVYGNIVLLNSALTAMGVDRPRIAVAGLNPHASEHGMFGNEEEVHIGPAIHDAVADELNVVGPLPPDTVFMRAFRGEFDGVVSMIHDHGFVALKSRNFDGGVNITIGLPIVRTSVGHGTAFDLAGTGKANEASLVEAINAAARIARSKKASSN